MDSPDRIPAKPNFPHWHRLPFASVSEILPLGSITQKSEYGGRGVHPIRAEPVALADAIAKNLVLDRTDTNPRVRYKRGMTKPLSPLPSQSEAFKNMIREMWRQYDAARDSARLPSAQSDAATSEKLVVSS
jgi:hypothetical protein